MYSYQAPRVILIDPDNLKRDLEGPELSLMLSQGWVPGPAFVHKDKGSANLALLVFPPPPRSRWQLAGVFALAAVVSAASSAATVLALATWVL